MAWYNLNKKQKKNPKKAGPKTFTSRFQELFLQRVGIVNSYDNDVRTYVEQGYQENPVVEGIVNYVAQNAARAKWCVKNANGEKVQIPILNKPSMDHRVLMVDPNPLQSWSDMNESAIVHYLLEGNAFLTGERGSGVNEGIFNTMYSLPSEDMQIIADPGFKGIQSYKIDFAWSPDAEIPATDVLHLKTPNPDFDESDNWLFGQSKFRAARRSIQTYNESLETGVWFLQNKGAQKILYNKNPDLELSPEGQDALKGSIRAKGQGPRNSVNLTFLDQMDLGVLDVSSNAAEALVLEQRRQAALEICNVMHFPPSLIGLSDTTYQNAKEAKKAMWEAIIFPILDKFKDGYNRWLAPQFGEGIYLDYEVDHIDALQEDRLMRGKAVKEFAGMITVNEARELAGFKPINQIGDFNGDDMFVGFTQTTFGTGDPDGHEGTVEGQDTNNKPKE